MIFTVALWYNLTVGHPRTSHSTKIMASFNGLLSCAQLKKALFDSKVIPDAKDRQLLLQTIRDMLTRVPDTGDVEMPFGKYKGKLISAVAHDDYSYIKWLYGSWDKTEDDNLAAVYAALTFYCNKEKAAVDAKKLKKRKVDKLEKE